MFEIRCDTCNKIVAYTDSSQPLPFLSCPDCTEKKKEK